MEKRYLFKNEFSGTSKKTGNAFRTVELHDPVTLENTTFFHDVNVPLDTTGLRFKDPVIVVHGVQNYQGKPNLTLVTIKKAQA